MDFKTRFQGKTSMITKNGGIDSTISNSRVPVNKDVGDTASSFNPGYGQGQNATQLIQYNSNQRSSGLSWYNGSYYGSYDVAIGSRNGSKQVNRENSSRNRYDPYKNKEQTSHMNIADLNDLKSDNIYLKGGSNMAEAMKSSIANEGSSGGTSIAMRMKRNREKAAGLNYQQDNDANQYQPPPIIKGQETQICAQTTGYSENTHLTQDPSPISSKQSLRPAPNKQNQLQTLQTPEYQHQSQRSKPPSSQQLRKSVENSRRTNFGNVSKQIVSTASTINYPSEPKPNEILKRQNSYVTASSVVSRNKQDQGNQRQRAVSVSNANGIIINSGSNSNKPQAFRNAGLNTTQQQKSANIQNSGQYQQKLENANQQIKSQQNANNQNQNNENPYLLSNFLPPLQNTQNTPQSQPVLSHDQLQRQLMLMQQQMMLLQQQQQQQQQMQGSANPQQKQNFQFFMNAVQDQNPDIYKQLELADQRFNYQNPNMGTNSITNYQSQSSSKLLSANETQNTSASGIYKPKSVKEYRKLQQTQNIKLGGLGANIGGEEWEKAKRKQEQAQEYARQLKQQNMIKPPNPKKKEEKPREKTVRERALEFSKNIPKPKPKQQILNLESDEGNEQDYNDEEAYTHHQQPTRFLNEDLNGIEEEPFDENGDTLREADLADLNKRHAAYANELEKIKQSIM